ncbi:hypothetical protein [Rosistilla oblonga]|uniref:hypothetical protein n=1 Tax=Rosistilla oblonga TaxID=2527990 RepID=UPI003A97A624
MNDITTEIGDDRRDDTRRKETEALIARGLSQREACGISGYREQPGEQLTPKGNTKWVPLPDEILAEAARIRSGWPDGLESVNVLPSGVRKNRDTRAARCSQAVPMRELSVDRRWEDDIE